MAEKKTEKKELTFVEWLNSRVLNMRQSLITEVSSLKDLPEVAKLHYESGCESIARWAIGKALVRVKDKIGKIDKDSPLKAKDKNGKEVVRSKYANLEDIQSEIDPHLIEAGIAFVFDNPDMITETLTLGNANKTVLLRNTRLRIIGYGHELSVSRYDPVDFNPFMSTNQSYGSATTYGIRYLIASALSLYGKYCADYEDILNDGDGNSVKVDYSQTIEAYDETLRRMNMDLSKVSSHEQKEKYNAVITLAVDFSKKANRVKVVADFHKLAREDKIGYIIKAIEHLQETRKKKKNGEKSAGDKDGATTEES